MRRRPGVTASRALGPSARSSRNPWWKTSQLARSGTTHPGAHLLESGDFLLDPRRLTVALSRARRKMILVAARSIFSRFSPDEETFAHALLWKYLLARACPARLRAGERCGCR